MNAAWYEATGFSPKQPSTDERKYSRCRSCKARIFWATTEQEKTIPMDAEPSANGTMFEDGNVMKCVSLINQPPEGAELFTTHFATCPDAGKHRKAVRK